MQGIGLGKIGLLEGVQGIGLSRSQSLFAFPSNNPIFPAKNYCIMFYLSQFFLPYCIPSSAAHCPRKSIHSNLPPSACWPQGDLLRPLRFSSFPVSVPIPAFFSPFPHLSFLPGRRSYTQISAAYSNWLDRKNEGVNPLERRLGWKVPPRPALRYNCLSTLFLHCFALLSGRGY